MNWRKIVLPIVRLYWRTFRPKTYGVKVIIFHPDSNSQILLVRHSYGNQQLWNLPGGGFKPKYESPEAAASREVREELGITLIKTNQLCIYTTEAEGKRDTVTILTGKVAAEPTGTNPEITEYCWREASTILGDDSVAKIAKYAVRHL